MDGHGNYSRSSLCLSSCFGSSDRRHQALSDRSDDGDDHRPAAGRCRNLIARIACGGKRRSDFSYDAMSYALNFESESPPESLSSPLRNFSDRLPASPPRTVAIR